MASNTSSGDSSSRTSRRPFIVWTTILLAIIGTMFSIVAVASCHFLSVPNHSQRTVKLGFFTADTGLGCAKYSFVQVWLTDKTPPMLRAARAFGVIAAALSGIALIAFLCLLCRKTMERSRRRALHWLTSRGYFFVFISQYLAILFFIESVENSCTGSGAECPIRLDHSGALAIVAAVSFLLCSLFLCTCGDPPAETMTIDWSKSRRQRAVEPELRAPPEESAPTAKSIDWSADIA